MHDWHTKHGFLIEVINLDTGAVYCYTCTWCGAQLAPDRSNATKHIASCKSFHEHYDKMNAQLDAHNAKNSPCMNPQLFHVVWYTRYQ